MGASQVNPMKPIFTCFELMTFVVLVFLPQPVKRSRAQRAGRDNFWNCHAFVI